MDISPLPAMPRRYCCAIWSGRLPYRVAVDIPCAHAFDPFFTTRLGHGGSGLGLYLTFNLVTGVLGGEIELETAPESGCRFLLRLPLIAPNSASPTPAGPGAN